MRVCVCSDIGNVNFKTRQARSELLAISSQARVGRAGEKVRRQQGLSCGQGATVEGGGTRRTRSKVRSPRSIFTRHGVTALLKARGPGLHTAPGPAHCAKGDARGPPVHGEKL